MIEIKHFSKKILRSHKMFKMLIKTRLRVVMLLLVLLVFLLLLVKNMSYTDLINTNYMPRMSSTLTTSTKPIPFSHVSITAGYICVIVSTVLWGGYLLPVKHYDTGDGVFFQFVMCISIWFTGIFVNCVRDFPKFYGLTVLGGVGIHFAY